jgi:predicted secreted protein
MSLPLAIAIFFVVWWTVFFIVLPFGVRTQDEENSVVPGSAPSAPALPRLARKSLITTLLALVVFAGIYWAMSTHAFTLDDIPLLPKF